MALPLFGAVLTPFEAAIAAVEFVVLVAAVVMLRILNDRRHRHLAAPRADDVDDAA
jgi:hypothetical protein